MGIPSTVQRQVRNQWPVETGYSACVLQICDGNCNLQRALYCTRNEGTQPLPNFPAGLFRIGRGGHSRDDSRCMGSSREAMRVKDQYMGMVGAKNTHYMGSLDKTVC
jgi:hypothetical protein